MLDPLTAQHWFMSPASRHSQQQTPPRGASVRAFVCVSALTWLIILSVLSVAFLKCNLREQHERCETPEKTTTPPSPAAALSVSSACIILTYLCTGMLGNWIPPLLPVKLSPGLNRRCVIYCNLAINRVIPVCGADWCAQRAFCCHIVTASYISICSPCNDNSSENNAERMHRTFQGLNEVEKPPLTEATWAQFAKKYISSP